MRYRGVVALAATLVIGLPAVAQQQGQSDRQKQEQKKPSGEYGVVRIGDQDVFRLPSVGIYSPEQRANAVKDAILSAIKPPPGEQIVREFKLPDDIQAGYENNHHVVLFRDKIVATITPTDAKASGLSPKTLAERWAQDLRDAMARLNIDERTAFAYAQDQFDVAVAGAGGTSGGEDRQASEPSEKDRQLASRIRAKLDSDRRLQHEDLDVDVRNGRVTLRGTVPDEQIEERAVRLIRDMEGVENVRSDLRIQGK